MPALLLEEVFPEGEDVPEADLTLDLSDPDAEGYILYTSGSTGKPKGVVHRQSILSCAPTVFAGQIPMTEHSRALNIAGFSFIASLWDFTTMLSCGGSVYIANETERKNMEMIHGLFTKRKITGMFCPPQMYSVLQKLYGNPPLEYVILAGEKAQGSEYPPGVLEAYASSESFCALLHPAGSGGPTCLGKPCRGVEVWLLDENGQSIEEPGVVGELCISSPWTADGYNNLPEETAQRFTENPFRPGTRLYHSGDQMAWDEDGNLIFHGRKDRMVKVRGYRVELGEIDQVMTRKEEHQRKRQRGCEGARRRPHRQLLYAGRTVPRGTEGIRRQVSAGLHDPRLLYSHGKNCRGMIGERLTFPGCKKWRSEPRKRNMSLPGRKRSGRSATPLPPPWGWTGPAPRRTSLIWAEPASAPRC